MNRFFAIFVKDKLVFGVLRSVFISSSAIARNNLKHWNRLINLEVSKKDQKTPYDQLASIGLIVAVSVQRSFAPMRTSHAPKYARQGVNVTKAVTVTQMAFVWFVKDCKLVATILNGTIAEAHVQPSVANRKPSSVRSNVCPNANVTKGSCSMPLAAAPRRISVTSRVQLESIGPIVAMSVQSMGGQDSYHRRCYHLISLSLNISIINLSVSLIRR